MTGPGRSLDDLERQFHESAHEASAPGSDDPLQVSDDELRSGPLGRRLARRRGYALAARPSLRVRGLGSFALAVVAAVALASAWGAWADVVYWVSQAPPLDLGHLGAYRLERAAEGAYARVEGVVSPRRATWSRWSTTHELLPLVGSRILVDRRGEPDPAQKGYGFRYRGAGRLVRIEEGGRWAAVREKFVAAGELASTGELWLLEDGVVPGSAAAAPVAFLLWAAAGAAALVLLAARLRSFAPWRAR